MSEVIRNTRKSRLVADFAEAVCELYLEENKSPSKSDIVERLVATNMSGPSAVIRSLLTEEMANELERYFAEVCKSASMALGDVDYHLVTTAYYKGKKRPVPETYEQARRFVCVFGNGQTGKSAGVRFPDASDEPDAMLYIATAKSIDVVNKAIETHLKRLAKASTNSALGVNQQQALREQLPMTSNAPISITQQ